jgi:hypothetical protein
VLEGNGAPCEPVSKAAEALAARAEGA